MDASRLMIEGLEQAIDAIKKQHNKEQDRQQNEQQDGQQNDPNNHTNHNQNDTHSNLSTDTATITAATSNNNSNSNEDSTPSSCFPVLFVGVDGQQVTTSLLTYLPILLSTLHSDTPTNKRLQH